MIPHSVRNEPSYFLITDAIVCGRSCGYCESSGIYKLVLANVIASMIDRFSRYFILPFRSKIFSSTPFAYVWTKHLAMQRSLQYNVMNEIFRLPFHQFCFVFRILCVSISLWFRSRARLFTFFQRISNTQESKYHFPK